MDAGFHKRTLVRWQTPFAVEGSRLPLLFCSADCAYRLLWPAWRASTIQPSASAMRPRALPPACGRSSSPTCGTRSAVSWPAMGGQVEVRDFTGRSNLNPIDRHVPTRFSPEFFGRPDTVCHDARGPRTEGVCMRPSQRASTSWLVGSGPNGQRLERGYGCAARRLFGLGVPPRMLCDTLSCGLASDNGLRSSLALRMRVRPSPGS